MSKDLYWLNKESRTFLSRDYLLPGVTPEARIREIAEVAQRILGIEGFADRFESYVRMGWFSLSSPIWSNFGLSRGHPISCNGSFLSDSMESLWTKLGEVGTMTQYGAGTSGFFGSMRPRGAPIKGGENGKASGPVHYMELFDRAMTVVSQGAVRRGSFAAYLPVEHDDIEEFLKIREEGNPIQHLSVGVTITDAWMKAMTEGDKDKRRVWGKILKKRFESGYPYIVFVDTANNTAPQVYKDKAMKVVASNLCVTGDTLIDVVALGQDPVTIRIQDLGFYMHQHSDVMVRSYDAREQRVVFSDVTAFAQTGESTDLIEIEDEQGRVLHCTPEHMVYTKNRGYVEAQHLCETDVLQTD